MKQQLGQKAQRQAERPGSSAAQSPDDVEVVRLRHYGTWIGCVIVLVLLAMLVHGLVTNSAFQWNVIWQYLFNASVLQGGLLTLELTAICMTIGIALGTGLAIMRLSGNFLLSGVSWTYTWVFRSVPILVQLIFWYNLGALYPHLSFGLPFGPALATGQTNHVISTLTAAIVGLGLAQAAYTGEIVRAGIQAVDREQHDAAMALGMKNGLILRKVVLPQAMRLIIPPLGNELIGMLKNTSLVSVIALADLFYSVQLIYARNYETIPLLITASIWYLIAVSILSAGQRLLERRYGRGAS
jgi:polar amino acid transport system permease protein